MRDKTNRITNVCGDAVKQPNNCLGEKYNSYLLFCFFGGDLMLKTYEESKNQVIEVALSLKKYDDQKYQEFVKKCEITDDDFEWFFIERIIRNVALAMLSVMFAPDSKLDILCIILALIFTLKALYFKSSRIPPPL